MRNWARIFVATLSAVVMVTAFWAGTKATATAEAGSKYIEVCSNGVVYVPPGTKFVTCRGKVMKVIAIVPRLENQRESMEDCYCPDCCGGACAVTVSCGNEPEPSAQSGNCPDGAGAMNRGGSLCTAYLACGD